MYMYTCVCTHIITYIHIHIYIYIYTHNNNTQSLPWPPLGRLPGSEVQRGPQRSAGKRRANKTHTIITLNTYNE